MGRILTLILGLATLGGIAYYVMYGRSPATVQGPGSSKAVSPTLGEVADQPHQNLENVRSKARQIEANDAKRAEDIFEKTQAAESQ